MQKWKNIIKIRNKLDKTYNREGINEAKSFFFLKTNKNC